MSDLSRFVQIRPDWSRFDHGSSTWFQRLSDTFWLCARPPVSRVLYPTARVVSRVGWRSSIWDDGSPPPRATYPEAARDEPLPLYLVLLRAGLAQPAGHPTAGALLPHHLTLAAVLGRENTAGTGRRYVSVRFPSARAAWELPSALSRGARTFLDLQPGQTWPETATARRPGDVHCSAVQGDDRSRASLAMASARWLRCRRTWIGWKESNRSTSALS